MINYTKLLQLSRKEYIIDKVVKIWNNKSFPYLNFIVVSNEKEHIVKLVKELNNE